MANVQHKDIIDPNIHEPKGVKFAANGTAYVANGTGSGAWLEIVTPGSLGITPSAVFTFDSNIGGTEYTSGRVFPGNWGAQYYWGDVRVDRLNGFLQVNKTGVYLVSATYSILADTSLSVLTINPTRTSSSLTTFQPLFFPSTTTSSPMITGVIVNLSAGQGFGLWSTVSSGKIVDSRVTATVQMTRLSDA